MRTLLSLAVFAFLAVILPLTSVACTAGCRVGEYGDCDGADAVEYCTGGEGQTHWYTQDCSTGERCVQGALHGSCEAKP